MSADALASCPTTGLSVKRVMQPFSPHYKGTGFYATDHRRATAAGRDPDRGSPTEPRAATVRAADQPESPAQGGLS
jgi:predicted nucleic acid-binding Zn ribbon protein